jgi:hypothetical protein
MGEAGLGRLLVMLAKISSSVKEFLRDDWGLQLNIFCQVENGLASWTVYSIIVMKGIVECLVRGFEAGVPTLKQSARDCRDRSSKVTSRIIFRYEGLPRKCIGRLRGCLEERRPRSQNGLIWFAFKGEFLEDPWQVGVSFCEP